MRGDLGSLRFGDSHVVSLQPDALAGCAFDPQGILPQSYQRARTHEKVRYLPLSKVDHTAASAAEGIERALKMLEGRWKLVILFHLFGGKLLRFSELERAISGISQKMLIQQLRQLESDGIVSRIVHPEVPPKVEYRLTEWGQSLCPALDALLTWAQQRPQPMNGLPVG